MVVTRNGWSIWNLFGACLLLFASNVPAQAEFTPINPKEFTSVSSIEKEIEKTRIQASLAEKEVAKFEKPLLEVRDTLRAIQSEQKPYLQQRDQLNKEIQEIAIYLFILDLPKISDARIALFGPILRHLLGREDIYTSLNGNVPKQLQEEIDFTKRIIEHFKKTKRAALKLRPTLKVPASVPQGVQPKQHLDHLVSQLKTRNSFIEKLQNKFNAGTKRLNALNRNFQKKQLNAVAHRARYYGLVALINSKFSPPYLTDIKVFARDDPRTRERLYHHAYVEEPPELTEINKQIEFLEEEMLPQAHKATDEAWNFFLASEKDFVAITEKWLKKNKKYGYILVAQSFVNIGLEFVESFLTLRKEGFTPAGVIFEGLYRTAEAFAGDVSIPDPKIDKDIIAYRRRISRQLQHPDLVEQDSDREKMLESLYARSAGYIETARMYRSGFDRMKDHLAGDQLGEFIKGGHGFLWSSVFEDVSKQAIRNEIILRSIDKDRTLKWLFRFSALNPNLKVGSLRRIMKRVEKHPNAFNKASMLLRGEIGDVSGTIVQNMKERLLSSETYKNLGKDLLKGAAVTYAKDVIKEAVGEKPLYEVATELAITEIEWLVRRYDFQVAGKVWRDHVMHFLKLQGSIGRLIEKRSKLKRNLTISVAKPLSSFDRLDVQLKFSENPSRPFFSFLSVTLGRETITASNDTNPYKFGLNRLPIPEGKHYLSIEALFRHDSNGLLLDRAPDTRAAFLSSENQKAEWHNYELEEIKPEFLKLIFHAPSFEIVGKKDAGYLPGNELIIRYGLTGSLAYRDISLTVTPGPEQPALTIMGKSKGDVRIRAPEKAGDYRIFARANGGSTPIATLNFRVVAPPPTTLRAFFKGSKKARAEMTVGKGHK